MPDEAPACVQSHKEKHGRWIEKSVVGNWERQHSRAENKGGGEQFLYIIISLSLVMERQGCAWFQLFKMKNKTERPSHLFWGVTYSLLSIRCFVLFSPCRYWSWIWAVSTPISRTARLPLIVLLCWPWYIYFFPSKCQCGFQCESSLFLSVCWDYCCGLHQCWCHNQRGRVGQILMFLSVIICLEEATRVS